MVCFGLFGDVRSKRGVQEAQAQKNRKEKQQLVTEPEIDPVVELLSETEEEVEAEDDQQKEIPIIVSEK